MRLASLLLALALAAAPPAQDRPAAPREFRAAWVATVDNIDWPSKPGLPTATQQAELTRILDRAQTLRLNALVFQVRPACDAFYASPFEPWSEWLTGKQGRAPDPFWDPLAFVVEGAHARGLELHAWFNPYRARHAQAKSPDADNHVARTTDLCVGYGDYLWLDPGHPQSRARTLRAVLDVVERYDVDGVHIDDYFYPYPQKGLAFPDERTFAAAKRAGFQGSRSDWRRSNVDKMIEALHGQIHRKKPWVKFGISPFGIARPGLPRGIEAGIDQYEDLYADVQRWLREGWCDYLSPQLYWPIAQTKQSYEKLLAFWPSVNPQGRHIWIGNYTSKVGQKGWPADELARQIELTRGQRGVSGNIHFSMKALMHDNHGLASILRAEHYAERALVPESPWLDASPPPAPQAHVAASGDSFEITPTTVGDEEVRFFALYALVDRRWRLLAVSGGERVSFKIPAQDNDLAVTALDRCGNESLPARLRGPGR